MRISTRPIRIAATLFAVLALLILVQVSPLTAATTISKNLADFAHVPLFATVSALLFSAIVPAGLRRTQPTPSHAYFRLGAIIVLLALSSELVQLFDVGRSVTFEDFLRNLAGGLIGILFCLAAHPVASESTRPSTRIIYVISALALTALAAAPTAWVIAAHLYRASQWPVIVDGKSRLQAALLIGYNSSLEIGRHTTTTERPAVFVKAESGAQFGVLVQEIRGSWDEYSQVCMELENVESGSLKIYLRFGNSPLFFRSSSFYRIPFSIGANSHVQSCSDISKIMHSRSSAMQSSAEVRSAAILTHDTENRTFILHQLWLQ